MKIILTILLFANFLFAHKLNLFLNQEDNKVYVSSYFASGSFCKNCDISVKDEKGNLLQDGKTDLNGEFVISNLSNEIFVEVKTAEGHGATSSLKIEKVEEDLKKSVNSKELEVLKEENGRLKSEIKALKAKESQNELIKMIFALLVIVGIFFILKRIKK